MYWGVFWVGIILLFFSILMIIIGSHIYNTEKKKGSTTEAGWWTIMIGSVFLVIAIALCIGSFFYHPAAKLELPILQAK